MYLFCSAAEAKRRSQELGSSPPMSSSATSSAFGVGANSLFHLRSGRTGGGSGRASGGFGGSKGSYGESKSSSEGFGAFGGSSGRTRSYDSSPQSSHASSSAGGGSVGNAGSNSRYDNFFYFL